MYFQIYDLAKETVFLLLEFNADVQSLLDWVIDRCYTGSIEVADGCFNALAAVFQTREYPCDHVAMLNLAVLNVGNPRIQTHETAQQLLHLLDTRFFQEEPIVVENAEERSPPLNDILLAVSYCHSQVFLCEQLANIHPDLTLPMISEITQRFQTARPSVRQSLLKNLLPWLHNMELLDPSIPPSNPLSSFLTRLQDNQNDNFVTSLRGDGWGSTQATEMALNNIFFLTVKFGDEHPVEVESMWSALLTWPNNLKVIIRYLVIITNVAASDLLLYVKRVMGYLGRAKPEKLVDELMNELQSIETLNMSIERTQTPPYYRLSPMRKIPAPNNTTDDEKIVSQSSDQLEKGILHTKRHSANEDFPSDCTTRTNSTASLRSITSTSSTQDQVTLTTEPEEMRGPTPTFTKPAEHRRSESPVPYPLPMPAYGGYFAPLNQFLPENLPSTPGFHRSNIAIMFLSDLVLDGLEIDWSPHLPLMLHVIFLGLDHSRPLVYEHCKKLLLNLLLLAASHDHSEIARLLLENHRNPTETLKIISEDRDSVISLDTPPRENTFSHHQMIAKSTFSIDSSATITPDSLSVMTDPDSFGSVEEVAKAILNFMDNKKGRPLWSCDDITPKMLNTHSATQLEYFLKCVVRCFKEIYPLALVEQRWSQTALQLSLSCSSRHYAGRSFQILRALRIRPSTQMLSDILSRLVETVAEQGEDMQGYVTEIMLTLEAAIDNLDLEFRPIDFMRELFMSTPNLANDSDARRPGMTAPKPAVPHHCRSTSYSVAVVTQKARAAAIDLRTRSSTDADNRRSNLARSRSAQSLKNLDQNGTEDKITLLTQMFWICVSLLESDYEYEFLLAVRLLDKILCHLQPERPECRDKLEKLLQQIKWPNFPGVQTLLLKGCTSNMASEATWSLLARVVLCINAPIMDPTGMWGFAMNVMAMLPYLVHNYEKNNQTCRDAADHVAQMCNQQSERLNNLATVMTLYSRGTFGKDSFQWTKCVVKYLHDVYSAAVVSMVTFLVEILEKGPSMYQSAVLQILHCLVHYIDINSTPSSLLNSELFNSASKHVQGANFKESLKILKLAVTRSSTLAAAPPVSSSVSSELSVFSHTSFAEAEIFTRIPKELPGRTLDFSVDLSKTPIIGRKYLAGGDAAKTAEETSQSGSSASSSSVSLSRKPSNNQDIDSVWRRPQSSQARTRERLVNLLTCFGQRVGLPKSPSVIFSQSSDTLDLQQSVASSGEEASLPDVPSNEGLLHDSSGNELMMTFKGFDFLDNELESENEDFFSQLDRRTSINMESSPTSVSRRHHFGSVPDLNIIGVNMQEIPISPSDSISAKEEGMSNDETESSTADESVPQDLAASSSILVQNATLERERRHSSPLTASTHSLYSNHSETDIVELSGNTASSSFSHLHTLYFNLQSDEVEEVWRGHVGKVLGEISLTHALSTCQIFPRLFREMRRRLMTMCKEACYYISKSDSLKSVASQILQVLDMVYLQMECPFIYVESDTLLGSRVIERHRFCVLEIQECFETYYMRKDQAEQCLESLKTNIKQQSLFDSGTVSSSGDEQKVDLCRKLYKLIFQLVQFFESYLKLLEVFRSVTRTPQVVDMSLQASSLQLEITTALQELENGQASPFNVDCKLVTKQEAITSLAEYLQTQQYLKAVQLLRSFRSMWANDVFGMTLEDDIVALLNIYCSSLSDKKTGIFVLTKTDLDLNHLHSHLMNIHLKLSTAWPLSVSTSVTTPTRVTEVMIRQSDSSSL